MIIKNKLDNQDKVKEISELCNGWNFPYYWSENQIYSHKPIKQYGGFTHMLYIDKEVRSNVFSIFYDLVREIFKNENIKIKTLYRLQINLLLNINIDEEEVKNAVHQDMELSNYKSLVYYINDSDGDTIIFNNDKTILESISPIESNYVIFDSNLFHMASIPTKHKKRLVINCIVEV